MITEMNNHVFEKKERGGGGVKLENINKKTQINSDG